PQRRCRHDDSGRRLPGPQRLVAYRRARGPPLHHHHGCGTARRRQPAVAALALLVTQLQTFYSAKLAPMTTQCGAVIGTARASLMVLSAFLAAVGSHRLAAQEMPPGQRPSFAGIWVPADPGRSEVLF